MKPKMLKVQLPPRLVKAINKSDFDFLKNPWVVLTLNYN